MLTLEEINCLGQLTNNTWGYPGGMNSKVPTASINISLQGETMTCTYMTIVNLMSDRNLRDQSASFEEESIMIIKEYIKDLKKEFKKKSERGLKCNEEGTRDSIEIITTSPYSPKRTGYYRRFTTFKVG